MLKKVTAFIFERWFYENYRNFKLYYCWNQQIKQWKLKEKGWRFSSIFRFN